MCLNVTFSVPDVKPELGEDSLSQLGNEFKSEDMKDIDAAFAGTEGFEPGDFSDLGVGAGGTGASGPPKTGAGPPMPPQQQQQQQPQSGGPPGLGPRQNLPPPPGSIPSSDANAPPNVPPGGAGPPPPHPGPAQPLASNVLGKSGPGGDRAMDQQYMQTSSQLFVFSTDWANKAAAAVMSSEFGSIVQWHEAQPETKKQLEVSFVYRFLHVYL